MRPIRQHTASLVGGITGRVFGAVAVAALLCTGCGDGGGKPAALDQKAWQRTALEQRLPISATEAPRVTPGPAWLDRLAPEAQPLFAGFRRGETGVEYVLVLDLDPAADRLTLWPLPEKRSPLELWTDPAGRQQIVHALGAWRAGEPPAGTRTLPLHRTLAEKRLGPPVPPPRRAFAVAANYLSHLVNDLAIEDAGQQVPLLTRARPRVFAKYPPVPPPGQFAAKAAYAPLGPFDAIRHPGTVAIPTALAGQATAEVPAFFDYEVEVAAVVGRSLGWEDVSGLTDHELQATVAGYVLASDFKSRNPQVMRQILTRERPLAAENPYRIGSDALDRVLGRWDSETCQWWSYAASSGENLTLGPFFFAAGEDGALPPRALLAARSYAAGKVRGHPVPDDLHPDVFYLRQLVLATSEHDLGDQLIWEIPAIIRSILDPRGNALDFLPRPLRLEPGDLILLGTPGGTVITSRPVWQLDLLDTVLFWLNARQWHDLFFRQGADNYLYPGDRLFFWGEGLGYQEVQVTPAAPGPAR